MKHGIKYVLIYIAILLFIWGGGYLLSGRMENIEVVSPEKGIKCAVVSRMFNTSIDCWKE